MRTSAPKTQQGVMLIEALIGILIFSIGILAMLGMQAVAMQSTIDSKYRSEASYLTNQIIGTIWIDRLNIASYDTGGAGNARLTAWRTEVERLLPQATGANTPTIGVVVDAGDPNLFKVTVTVKWQRPGDTAASRHISIAQIDKP